jgi:hypothetical protein
MTPEEARRALHEFAGTDRWSNHDTALFDGQLDNYAHELAELIRADIGPHNCPRDNLCQGLCEHCSTRNARLADADLIDPEVE